MEDTTVCKGMYAYQFRVDISGNSQSTAEMKKFLETYQFEKYIGQFEISDNNKPHYQMCLWRKAIFTSHEQTKARNWWRGKTLKTKQPVSLTSAKKIKSLASYCQKGSKMTKKEHFFQHFNNLSKEENKLIPKWESKLALKKNKREIYKSTLKSMCNTLQKPEKYEFLKLVNKAYYSAYKQICLRKQVYITALYEYNYIEDGDIISHVFTFGIP